MTKPHPITKDGANRRNTRRIFTSCTARLVAPFADVECELCDLSEMGARVKADCDLEQGDQVALDIEGVGGVRGEVVRVSHDGIGIKFDLESGQSDRLFRRLRGFIERSLNRDTI